MQEAALWHPCSASAPSPAQDTLSVAHGESAVSRTQIPESADPAYLDENFGDTHLASKN